MIPKATWLRGLTGNEIRRQGNISKPELPLIPPPLGRLQLRPAPGIQQRSRWGGEYGKELCRICEGHTSVSPTEHQTGRPQTFSCLPPAPPPQFSSGATALCEDQWKETGSERWGQNWEFIPKLDCPELLRPDREPGPRLSDPSTLVEFGFNSSVNQRAAASFRLTARAGHSMTESPPPCCPRSATAAGLACASVAAEA